MLAFVSGLFAGWSLIIAIGAQNAFVIRQGLTKKHVFVTVVICTLGDILLIAAGVAGLGAVIQSVPIVLEIVRWLGCVYLLWFAYKSIRAALSNQHLEAERGQSAPLRNVVLSTLGITFLNPHVYLDTVIFLGSIANQFQGSQWLFAFGAMLGSVTWFFSLGFGASKASKIMSKPIFWRVLDSVIAVIMISLAVALATMRL